MTSLARQIIDAHRPVAGPGRPALPPRPDMVLLGPSSAAFVLRLADSVLRGAPSLVRAICWWDRPLLGPAPDDDEGRVLFECAARLGVPLLAPVGGACEPGYRESLAAPGRLVASCGMDGSASGALGVRTWRVSPLEAAALLCGAPVNPGDAGEVQLVLSGTLPPGVGGIDVALEFGRRSDVRSLAGRGLEVSGAGVSALTMGDRVALARTLHACGAGFVLLPSDDVTRSTLRAWGRDADWRELPTVSPPAEPRIELDLDTLEPLVAPASDAALARPLRHALEHPLHAVSLGPFTDEDDISVWVQRVSRGRVATGMHAHVLPGTVGLFESLVATGERDTLQGAGVALLDPVPVVDSPRSTRGETMLSCGHATGGPREPERWLANPAVCIASALAGRLSDPRHEAVPAGRAERRARAGTVRSPAALPPSERPDAEAAPASPEIATAATAALRAVVWLAVGDDCASDRVVSRSARARRELLDDSVADLFPGQDRGWTKLVGGGARGVVLAGRQFGGGEMADEAAWALRRAGVVAVLAISFESEARRSLVAAGVLPLEAGPRLLREAAEPGDELEFPSLPEAVEPGHPVGVRNLTRGVQATLDHRLTPDEVGVWRAGGLIALA